MPLPVKIDPAKARKVAIPVAAVLLLALVLWKIFGGGFLYAGTVEATEVDLSARVSSIIEKLEVSEGDTVTRGQELVRLACEDLRLAAGLAEGNYRRAEELFQSGSMSRAEYDRTRYQRDDAFVRNSWCGVKAPISGVVLSVYHEPGELVGPGVKLVTLADLSTVWTVIYIPQPMLARLKAGAEVTGFLPEMAKKKFPGRIAHIREKAEFTPKNVQTREERTRLVYGIKVSFPNPDGILKPGMTIEVRLPRK